MPNPNPGRIGLSAWSIRWKIWGDDPAPSFRQAELPALASEEFGIDTVELYNNFLESHAEEHLRELCDAAERHGVTLHGMAVDVPYGDMCAEDPAERRVAVAQNMCYVPVAEGLGLTYFRVNPRGSRPPRQGEIERAIQSYRELTDVAWDRGVRIAIENHGGISHTPEAVLQIIEEVGADRMGTLPDIGNFHDDPDAYDKIAQMAPYAVAVHAKLCDFDEDGEATNIDVARMAKVLGDAGFEGPWSIETGDPAAKTPDEAIRRSRDLLQRHIGQ